jgi:hypothetical protein
MATESPRGREAQGPASAEPMTTAPDSGSLTPDHTLNEIVARLPGAEGPLLHLGYDTCCGGARTLREASAALGLDPAEVLAQVGGEAEG